ncbi:MAG: pilus assembly protein PilM [Candidatus Omnitrophica bacterium]|nr:pilus assembly protein PilM [Candidatus Omnitrophota bacterium]
MKYKTILKFIEPFQKKMTRFLSIDFNHSSVELVHMESSAKGYRILAYAFQGIPDDVGDLSKVMTGIIQSFLKDNNIQEKEVVVSISDVEFVFVQHLELPVLPKDELLGAAKWKLKEEAPFDIETACIDWHVVREYEDADGARKVGIVFIAIARQTVDSYLSILDECGLSPFGITSASFNYSDLFKDLPGNPEISAVLDIDCKDTVLSIYVENKLCFTREIPVSAQRMTQALTESLVSEKGRISLTYDEAENLKNKFGIPVDENARLTEEIPASYVLSLLRPVLETIVREIRFSFDYFVSTFGQGRPEVLYITGEGANLKNLGKYLRKETGIGISYLFFPPCIDARPQKGLEIGMDDQNRIVNAVGAAMGGARTINLLPFEIQTQRIEQFQRVFLRLCAVSVGAIFLFLLFITEFQIRDYRARLEYAKRHLQAVGEIKFLKQKIIMREGLMEKIVAGHLPVNGLLKVVGTIVPKDVVLRELFFDHDQHSVVMKGAAPFSASIGEPVLTVLMEQLESSSFFEEATLVSSDIQGVSRVFEIKCDLVY